jgi:Ca2+-binding RTX toxin-like protein
MREFGYEGDPSKGGSDWVISSANIDLKDVYNTNDSTLGFSQLDYVENGMFIENIQCANGTVNIEASGNWLNNYILGNQSNNKLSGEYGNDTLVGDAGNDSIFGGAGNDSLVGTNSSRAGFGEIDTLTGDGGSDIWVLGDANNVYYSGQCDLDYAYMTDYAGSTIELRGKLSDYLIRTVATGGANPQPFSAELNTGTNLGNGTYIFLDNADARGRTGGLGTEDDLIAFAVNWTGSSTLKFVN